MSIPASSLPVPVQPGPPALPPAAGDGEEGSSGMSVAQILCIFKAFWKYSLITFLVIVVIAAIGIRAMPKMYVATAALLVNNDAKNPLIVQQGGGGDLGGTFIPTQIELITSASVLQPVIDKLDLSHDKQFEAHVPNPAAAREAVLNSLRQALTVSPGRGSQLLYIAASYPAAERAAAIANAVSEEYIKQERERVNNPANERYKTYSRDLADLKQKVTEAQERVTAFRREHSLVDFETGNNNDVETTTLNDIATKLSGAQNTLRELESRQLKPDGGAEAVLGNAEVQQLRAKLTVEQEQMAQLGATLGPKHPSVIELQQQINTTKKALSEQVSAIGKNIKSQIDEARKLVAKYQAAYDAQRALTVDRKALKDQAGALLVQLNSAEATYKAALDGFDRSRFESNTDLGKVTLVESAVPPAKAEKPNKPKLFMMAFMAALALGLGWPFAYELLYDRRLRCRDDLEKGFGIPVLAQFEPIKGSA